MKKEILIDLGFGILIMFAVQMLASYLDEPRLVDISPVCGILSSIALSALRWYLKIFWQRRGR
jgi:hypothetical protein